MNKKQLEEIGIHIRAIGAKIWEDPKGLRDAARMLQDLLAETQDCMKHLLLEEQRNQKPPIKQTIQPPPQEPSGREEY